MPEQKSVHIENGVVSASYWNGPLPSPDAIERFEKLNPGTLNRLLAMTEQELSRQHEQTMEELSKKGRESAEYHLRASRGQLTAFILCLVAFAVAALCAYLHKPTIGVASLGITLVGIVKHIMTKK